MADESGNRESADEDRAAARRLRELTGNADAFARAITSAFRSAVVGGKQFDDVLKSLVLRLSDLALRAALRPLERSLADGIGKLLGGIFDAGSTGSANIATALGIGTTAATGAVKPFATGGVIGTPTYFPLMSGGVGLAGEAGPEAILPLARGSDGRLGVAAAGTAPAAPITIHIATPDAESFRRSEAYVTGQIARAVARGQRGL